MAANNEWWRGAVLYQIYPRSFRDSNNDGIGDLKGITEKLDYVASLGVEGIWISPFFKSPMKDFGYDVEDYRTVDPIFGTNDDFDSLLTEAHKRNIKIIVDLVMSHTSDQHPWFVESRSSRDNPKADWYVWADPNTDGTPPNNWQSLFGNSSWQFDTRRGQYYLHNFLKEQPDLNFHNPEVRAAMLDIASYWLDKGVDGFRLDVINFCFHDKELRNNPPKETDGFTATQLDFKDPYGMQQHIYDKSRPENLGFIEDLRALTNEYDNRFLLGEIGDNESAKISAEYTSPPNRLHTTYNFSLMHGLQKELTATLVRNALEEQQEHGPDGWPSWAFSNHDVVRSLTRFGGNNAPPALAKMLLALLTSLRGTAFVYQGEELGLPDVKLPLEVLQDPWGIALWPEWQGRDGCRTPIPWTEDDAEEDLTGKQYTWLPIPAEHAKRAIALQENDPAAPLNFTRRFLKWRKEQPALITGEITFHDTDDNKLLAFTRTAPEQTIYCLFNLGDSEKTGIQPQGNLNLQHITETPCTGTWDAESKTVTLPPYSGIYFSVSS